MHERFSILILIAAILTGTFAVAQRAEVCDSCFALAPLPPIEMQAPLPRVTPVLALDLFLQSRGGSSNVNYSDHTVVHAELPDIAQKGDYELVRTYSAQPRSLSFASVSFTGDGFVKSNVILRVLQSEVDRTQKDDPTKSAISQENYKFSYKGMETVNGTLTHVFQVKPRHKRPGLFKGRIYLDASSGHLRRAEGTPVKSPSFFIRQAQFVQDFGDYGGYTLPTRLHSTAKARVIGRAVLDIAHHSYQFAPLHPKQSEPRADLLNSIPR